MWKKSRTRGSTASYKDTQPNVHHPFGTILLVMRVFVPNHPSPPPKPSLHNSLPLLLLFLFFPFFFFFIFYFFLLFFFVFCGFFFESFILWFYLSEAGSCFFIQRPKGSCCVCQDLSEGTDSVTQPGDKLIQDV